MRSSSSSSQERHLRCLSRRNIHSAVPPLGFILANVKRNMNVQNSSTTFQPLQRIELSEHVTESTLSPVLGNTEDSSNKRCPLTSPTENGSKRKRYGPIRAHLVQPLLRTLSSAFKTHCVWLNTVFWMTLGTAKILCRSLRLPDLWWLMRAPRRCRAPCFPVPPRRLEAATDVCIYEVMSVASSTDDHPLLQRTFVCFCG